MNNQKTTDVFVLCGGLGSRLRDKVSDRQKCVVEINGISFLRYLLDFVKSFGYHRFILCTGHMSNTVRDTVKSQISDLDIVISEEPEPLGTGGAIKYARKHFNSDRALILNGDSFCQVDLDEVEQFHCETHSELTMVLAKRQSDDCGNVEIDDFNRIRSFEEKTGMTTQYVNAGLYIIEKHVLDDFPKTEHFSLEKDVFPNMLKMNFYGFHTDSRLLDIGTPERLETARKHILHKQ